MKSYFEKVDMPDEAFKIKSFHSNTMEQVIEVHPHWHTEVEILYYVKGCAMQQINEQFFIAEEGDLVIIAKDRLHSTYSYKGIECDILVIMFDACDLLDLTVKKNNLSVSVYGSSTSFLNPIKTSGGYGKAMLNSLKEIHNELSGKAIAYNTIIKSHLYGITGLLIRNHPYETNENILKTDQNLKQILLKTFNLIDEYFFEDISLTKAASISNLSIAHFCRLFKKATGMTFNNYLTFYRVNRAEKMLNMQKTITEIALECGFGSLSSFIRNFKKYKNCTPSSYRRSPSLD